MSHVIELVLLYVPLGFFVGQIAPRRHRAVWLAIGLTLAVAGPIEYLQGWVVGRYPDVTDIGISLCGAWLGHGPGPPSELQRADTSREPAAKTAGEPRVLQVVLSLNPGGTERLVVDLVRRLRGEMGMAVCCLDEVGAWGTQLRAEGVPVTALARRPGFRPGLGRQIALLGSKQHGSTVIHAHQYTPFVYACFSRPWLQRVPVVFTEHGRLSDAPASAKRRLANRVLRRVPARVFAVSEDLKRFMVTEGFRAENVDVLHNGIDVGPLPRTTIGPPCGRHSALRRSHSWWARSRGWIPSRTSACC